MYLNYVPLLFNASTPLQAFNQPANDTGHERQTAWNGIVENSLLNVNSRRETGQLTASGQRSRYLSRIRVAIFVNWWPSLPLCMSYTRILCNLPPKCNWSQKESIVLIARESREFNSINEHKLVKCVQNVTVHIITPSDLAYSSLQMAGEMHPFNFQNNDGWREDFHD